MEYTSLKSEDFYGIVNYGGTNNNSGLKQLFNINLGDLTYGSVILCIIIIIAVILFVRRVFNINGNIREGMSGGTLTQLFAQDTQNTNLNGVSNDISSGNFDFFFNQPTRVASGTQRGTPLNQVTLPNTSMNPMKNNDNKIKPDEPTISCSIEHPEACGGGIINNSGNINYLADGFIQPTNSPREFVGLNGKVHYPDSYVGSYFTPPRPDLLRPLKVMETGASITSKPYLPIIREGYE